MSHTWTSKNDLSATQLLLMIVSLALLAGASFGDPNGKHSESMSKAEAFSPLTTLAGRCFLGEMAGADAKDFHCWDWALDGRYLRDRHRVKSPQGTYEGEAFFGIDYQTGGLRFWYFNNIGGRSEGRSEQKDGQWIFAERYSGPDGEIEMRSFFRLEGEDGYSMLTEQREGETWKEVMRVRFRATDDKPGDYDQP